MLLTMLILFPNFYSLFLFRLPDESLDLNTTSVEYARIIPLKSPKPRITQPSIRMYRTTSNEAEGVLEGDGCIADLQDVVNSHEVSFIPVNSPYNQVG